MLGYIRKKWFFLLLSSSAIAVNWLTYIYAVNNGYVFEASLAYFISPMVSIMLGFLFLKESLNFTQMLSVLITIIAIAFLLVTKQVFPVFALIIAISFSLYGILGRVIDLPIFDRMALESGVISLVFLLFLKKPSSIFYDFLSYEWGDQILLVMTGAVTIIPLSFYIISVKRISFSTVGVLSFILPTIVFLMSCFYFHEPLDQVKLISIVLIWISVSLYIKGLIQASRLLEV